MKFLFSLIFLLLINLSFGQNDTWKKKYTQRWENTTTGTQLIVDNENYLPITYVVDYQYDNLKPSVDYGTYVVIPARSNGFLVCNYDKVDSNKGWKTIHNNTLVYLGDLTDTTYDEDFLYELPFEKGKSFKVGQGYNGNISHQEKKAIDFNMPVGTKIFASREGVVVDVVRTNSKNCAQASCAKYNNYIKVLHSDGTIMQYLHLKKFGVKVKVGQKVKKGQHIGFSGNTGWSTGPHLHLELYLIDRDNNYTSLPMQFNSSNGIIDELLEGEIFTR